MRIFVVALLLAALALCILSSGFSSPETFESRPAARYPALRERIARAARDENEKAEKPRFAPAGHFYAGTAVVSISSGLPDARIHYTTDGSEPTENSPLYTRPLSLEPGVGTTNCVVVKAVAVSSGRTSPVTTHSYFLDPGITTRFDSYVFSLSTDDDNLYDHDKGIMIPGKRRADSVALYPDKSVDAHDANYKGRGRKWERPVYVEIFQPDGTRVIAQKAGLRVFGGGTRHFAQKPLRLIARKIYTPKTGKFHYPFFPELAPEKNPSPILSYDSIILSNGGNDLTNAQIRTPLLSRIAAEAGYSHVAPVRSAAVFLNGKYYGHAYLTIRLDDSFFADLHNAPRDNFIVLVGGNKVLKSSPKYPELLHWRLIRRFRELTAACEQDDKDENIVEKIRRQVDIDNLLLYYALEIYADNNDWLKNDENNVKVWRYYGENDPPNLDGRWRYILHDLDATALSAEHGANPTLGRALKESPLLGALMRRPELAAKFANHLCDMAFAHFTEPNVRKVMAALDGESRKEIQYAARHGVYSPPELPETIARGRENILAFFRERPEHVLRELREIFGYTDLYRVLVDGPAKINTVAAEGWYFVENSVIVTPALPWGRAVRHWEVNGEIRAGEHLEITARDAVDGVVRVRIVTEEKPSPLIIESPYDRGGICGFSIRNVTSETLSAQDLYLSDKLDKPKKYPLTSIHFAPGETLNFVGKGSRHADSLLKLKVNFNPRRGETVYLRDKSGEILSSATVR